MDFKKFLKGNKEQNIKNLLVILLVGIALVIVASFFKDSGGTTSKTNTQQSSLGNKVAVTDSNSDQYEDDIKNELKNTLESIQGVGRVQVMVTFGSGDEQVPAYNVTDSSTNTDEKDTNGGERKTTENNNGSSVVTTTGSDGTATPFIVKTNKPKATGVCVVADGAEVDLTRLRLTKAVMDLLDVSEDKVNVYPMKK